MIRKVLFGFVLVTAVIVSAACGRQVTPNPPGLGAGGAPPGYMVIKFDVSAPFNFSNYQYWIVFNTTGNGYTPGTIPQTNNFLGYSTGIMVGGAGGGTYASSYQWLRSTVCPNTCPVTLFHFPATAQQLQYTANSNGSGTEFTVLVSRSVFIPVNATPSPGTSPTPSPTPSPSGSPSTGPSPTPSGTPLPFAQTWTFNAFVTQGGLQGLPVFVDSMGAGGPNNPQYSCCSPPIQVNTSFDNVYYALYSGAQLDPTAQIVSVEIGNNP
ncbi:MAG TPA: hypothetical protein VMF61_00985 [Candidatus Acidoferrales bacterium]|nr:hypothetical protein [Candidatus Acidoferrales bacterium]